MSILIKMKKCGDISNIILCNVSTILLWGLSSQKHLKYIHRDFYVKAKI